MTFALILLHSQSKVSTLIMGRKCYYNSSQTGFTLWGRMVIRRTLTCVFSILLGNYYINGRYYYIIGQLLPLHVSGVCITLSGKYYIIRRLLHYRLVGLHRSIGPTGLHLYAYF